MIFYVFISPFKLLLHLTKESQLRRDPKTIKILNVTRKIAFSSSLMLFPAF